MAGNMIKEIVKKQIKELKNIKPGYFRARYVHQKIDEVHSRWKENNPNIFKNISCFKKIGCSHCCHQLTQITDDEADLLAEVYFMAHKNGYEIDLKRLKKQAGWMDDRRTWMSKPVKERTCVFLKDSLCSVYKYRPAVCRNFMTVSKSTRCEKVNETGAVYEDVRGIRILGSDAIAAASISFSITKENLAKKLYRRINK